MLNSREAAVGKSLLLVLAFLVFPLSTAYAACENSIDIKYRDTPYCTDGSTCVDTPTSSFIRRTCYNEGKAYMTIKLNQTWYHYCRFDSETWNAFLAADSKGGFYNVRIKGNFDCRLGGIPE